MRALRRDPRGSNAIWRDLALGWGGWAASPDLLAAVAAAAIDESGAVLECGSGLTTLVLATIAEQTGGQVWSLEHDRYWYEVTDKTLREFGLHVNLEPTPLRSYGDFDWYDVDPNVLPRFSLVVCDGPPGSTRGGRYGLIPVLRDRLSPGCVVLLDDADRPSEEETLGRWRAEASLSYELRGGDRTFAVATTSGVKPPSPAPRRVIRRSGLHRLRPVAAGVVIGLALLGIFGALPEALGDQPYDPCPSRVLEDMHC
jgi:hypothetical protein